MDRQSVNPRWRLSPESRSHSGSSTDTVLTPRRAVEAIAPSRPRLIAKLQPERLPAGQIRRRRLLEAVSGGIQGGPLTLLSAVAGSGKTVLAASWAAARPVPWPVAWLTLDSSDNLPVRFWAYVIDSLRRAGLDLAGLQEQLD